MENKVNVKCMVNHAVGINVRSIPFRCEWIGKGAERKIDRDILEQIMYDPGVRYMFESGMLYIEEMETKQELGLEPEEAEEPVNIIILTDKQKRNCLINMPYNDFTSVVDKLSIEQLNELVDYAVENKLIDFERDEYIKNKCGRDIINTIRLMRENKEA